MKYSVSSIWQDGYDEKKVKDKLERCIERGVKAYVSSSSHSSPFSRLSAKNSDPVDRIQVFFRADDIGVPGKNFSRMLSLFSKYRIPLGLAVVPTWITNARWEQFQSMEEVRAQSGLWCWHHHGWRHMNHESIGKKQEFGPSRSKIQLMNDLKRGTERLESIFGDQFTKIFTPPWNRCSAECINVLIGLGYQGISRFENGKPKVPDGLGDVSVNVDLHTLKASDPVTEWEMLMAQLERAIGAGTCGIMVHHQKMNQNAFDFIELLFNELERKRLNTYSMSDILKF